jgi:hypothetical protein
MNPAESTNPMDVTCMSDEFCERATRVVDYTKQLVIYSGLQHHLSVMSLDPYFYTSGTFSYAVQNILKLETEKAKIELIRLDNLLPFSHKRGTMMGVAQNFTSTPRMPNDAS